MHPTNIRQKYENVVRDHLVRMGADVADEIEYEVMLNVNMNLTVVLRIAAYDGFLIVASRAMFPKDGEKHVAVSSSEIGDTVAACLMELKRKIEDYDKSSGWWEERVASQSEKTVVASSDNTEPTENTAS